MTHDPYQTYQTVGAYSGLTNPFSSPYSTIQTSAMNPAAAFNPLTANAGAPWGVPSAFGQQPGQQGFQGIQGFSGIPNYGGISPQQLQLAAALAAQAAAQQATFANPWQNPFNGGLQSQVATAGWQNPFAMAALQNPLLNPVLAQIAASLGQQVGGQQIGGQQIGGQQLGGQQIAQQQPYFQQPYTPYAQPYQHLGHAGMMGQQGVPNAQFNAFPGNPQFTPQLAPQSWVGQGVAGPMGQFGGGQGQLHPLHLQLAARALQTQGINPWGAF